MPADALRHRIEETLGCEARVPEHREVVVLSGGGSGRIPTGALRLKGAAPA